MESATTCDGSGVVEATYASLNQGQDGTASEQLKVVEIVGTTYTATPTAADKPPLPTKTTVKHDGYFTSNDDGNDNRDDDDDDDDDDDEDDDEDYANDDDGYYNDPERYLLKAIYFDDKPEFVAQMKLLFDLGFFNGNLKTDPNTKKRILCPKHIIQIICCSGAVACATALLEGHTCSWMDLNFPLDTGENPLHLVAQGLNYDLVKLFLSHGARADDTNICLTESSLPLNRALEKLNNHLYLVGWTPEESIYKLLIILCLPQMNVALETIKLLALSTKGANKVFIDYAMEGKLIEMAVLLLVANDHVMAPSTYQSDDGAVVEGGMTIRDTIMQDFLSQANEKGVVSVYNGEKRSKLIFTLILLKIFERAGDAIRSYIQSRPIQVPKVRVVKDVASLLKEAGFVLKEKDIDLSNIDCESDEIKEATGTSENIAEYKSANYFSMVCCTWEKYFIAQKREEVVVKDVASILKETGFVLKDNDIGLSNIHSESNEIKEATGSSEKNLADEPETYLDMLPLDYISSTRPSPLGCSLNPRGNFSSLNLLTSHHVRKFSDLAFSKRHNNQFKTEKNAMRRSTQPSNSRIVLVFLAMSVKKGLRRL